MAQLYYGLSFISQRKDNCFYSNIRFPTLENFIMVLSRLPSWKIFIRSFHSTKQHYVSHQVFADDNNYLTSRLHQNVPNSIFNMESCISIKRNLIIDHRLKLNNVKFVPSFHTEINPIIQ